jgi:glycosyltransferase involved in cell wall biosynthesis
MNFTEFLVSGPGDATSMPEPEFGSDNYRHGRLMNTSESVEITVLMPCLNEVETLAECVAEARQALRDAGLRGEVLVADNGSTDGSPEVARANGARVVQVARKGYGSALSGGIAAAAGSYVIMGDADGSYDFGELPKFVERLRAGDDLVMGCRMPRGGGTIRPGAMPWKHRWIGNPVLSGLGRIFFRTSIDDFHCGLRGFRRDAIRALELTSSGMEFASEMVVKATLSGLKVSQIPITLRRDGRSRAPHLRSWRDGWRHLRFMLLFSPSWLFLYPGIILTVLGGSLFLLLLPGPLTIGSVTFDLNSLLVACATMLVGFQVLAFGGFVRTFAMSAGLLPVNDRWRRFVEGRPVEWGIAWGVLFSLVGLGYLIAATVQWRSTGFGPLPVQDSMRMVIPAVVGVSLGVQTVFAGFALAILGLKR